MSIYTWTSVPTWEGYSSNGTGNHTLFIGTETPVLNEPTRMRTARLLFKTPNNGATIGTISFTSTPGTEAAGYYPAKWEHDQYSEYAWKITSTSDFSCQYSADSYHGLLEYKRPRDNGEKGYFASVGSANVNLQPNTEYALWIFPATGYKYSYLGDIFSNIYRQHSIDFSADPLYTVTYNANGGTSTPATQTKYHDVSLTLAGAISKPNSSTTVRTTFNPNGGSLSSSASYDDRTVEYYYAFSNWQASNGSLYAAGGSYAANESTTMTAVWKAPELYSVDYVRWPSSPTRTGYTFAGWYNLPSGGQCVSNETYRPTQNNTVYAQWIENTYYVYYKNGLATGGTLPGTGSRTYTANATIATNSMTKSNTTANGYTVTYNKGTATGGTLPSAQTATDTIKYSANGWTTGSSNTNDCDYSEGASYGANTTNNLTLYPNFTTSTTRGSVTLGTNSMSKSNTSNGSYTVTLNANGGSVSSSSLAANRYITYTANGWTKTSGSTTRNYTNGQSVQMTAALTLYPCFKQSNTTEAVTLPTPTRSGYTFKGWGTSATSTEVLPSNLYVPSDNETLYAVWSQNVSITKNLSSVTVNCGETATVSLTAVGDGLTYTWYYKNYGASSFSKTTSFTSNSYSIDMNNSDRIGRQVYCIIKDANGNSVQSNTVTLNAQYTIIFDGNGANAGSMANSVHNCRETKSLTANAYKRSGHTYLGWSTSNTATSATYSNGQEIKASSPLTLTSATVTLYAVWKIDTYSVTYNANGGSSTPSAQTKTYNQNLTLQGAISRNSTSSSIVITFDENHLNGSKTTAQPSVTRSYTFSGWKDGDGTVYSASGTYTKNKATTMTAQWSYTDTGTKVSLPTPNPRTDVTDVVTEFDFKGWYTEKTGGTWVNPNTFAPTTDTTIYAQWTVRTYMVSFNTNGADEILSPLKKNSGESLQLYSAPAYSDTITAVTTTFDSNGGQASSQISTVSSVVTTKHTFINWTDSDGDTYAGGAYYTKNAATTMIASWTNEVSGSALTAFPTDPTRNGYIFQGWFTSPEGGTKVNKDTYKPTSNTRLYAQWKAGNYKLYISADDGAVISVSCKGESLTNGATIVYGSTISVNIKVKNGYQITSQTHVSGDYEVKSDITISATSKLIQYTLSMFGSLITEGFNYKVERMSSSVANAALGVLQPGSKIYYNDKLQISASMETQKPHVLEGIFVNDAQWTSGNAIFVTSDVKVNFKLRPRYYAIGENETTFGNYYIYIADGEKYEKYVAYIANGTTWNLFGE